MRIAYVCTDPGVPVFGRKGSSIHCQEVMRTFVRMGFEVHLFCVRLGKDEIPDDLKSIQIHSLKIKLSKEPALRERELIQLNESIRKQLEEFAPFDLVYERFSLWSHAAMDWGRSLGLPTILEANAPLVYEQKTYRTLVDDVSAVRISEQCFSSASSIVAVSEEVANRLTNTSNRKKITVIGNGFNSTLFEKNARNEFKSDYRVNICFVGTLKPWHGVDTLLEAYRDFQQVYESSKLTIIGDGPEREHLHRIINSFPPHVRSSIECLGAILPSEIPERLARADIGVAPYPELTEFYFSPLKLIEYMAAGLAVVASDLGQISSLIQHEQTGLLVKPGCATELSKAFIQLSNDEATRSTMGAAAREYAFQNHTWEHVVKKILNLASIELPQGEVVDA